jgi:hypothetical protein
MAEVKASCDSLDVDKNFKLHHCHAEICKETHYDIVQKVKTGSAAVGRAINKFKS